MPINDLAFWRKKPVAWIRVSSSAASAPAIALASGKRANRAGVTRFTRASVDWADNIVAASNSNALRCASSVSASG